MTERRYRDNEVREIFERATRKPSSELSRAPNPEGLTLAEIQSIGREAGIGAEQIARAAAELAQRPKLGRRSLGMPIEVEHITPLPRALTDYEWEQLVGELRATFKANGRIASHGSMREWSNGNLHAYVEPTGSGYRLRLRTLKGDALGFNLLGATGLVASAVVSASMILAGEIQQGLAVPWIFGAGGLAAFAANFIRLPRWAKQRSDQMGYIATRIAEIMKQNPEP